MTAGAEQSPTTVELTVAGPLGPVLRHALPGRQFVTLEPSTVITLHDKRGRDLADLVRLFDEAGLRVEDAYQVSRPQSGIMRHG